MKRLLVQISGQNTENMNTLVESLKEGYAKKDDSVKTTKLTKPAKVPTWTKDVMLETYVKQLEAWNEVNENVPAHTKF